MYAALLAGLVIAIDGALVSGGGLIVQATDGGDGSASPLGAVAATETECCPAARPVKDTGETQKTGGALSSEHENRELEMSEANAKVAVVDDVDELGEDVIVVVGAGHAAALWTTPAGSTLQ